MAKVTLYVKGLPGRLNTNIGHDKRLYRLKAIVAERFGVLHAVVKQDRSCLSGRQFFLIQLDG